jgi:histidinol dehydrogenase
MPLRLASAAAGFARDFARLLELKRAMAEDVDAAVTSIVADVRKRGDEALIDYTKRFDRVTLSAAELRVAVKDIATAESSCPPAVMDALRFAAARIEDYHRRQIPQDLDYKDSVGVELGSRWRPVEACGIYVPGGKAAYPSSVLMNAIPAKVAGVPRIVMVVPAPDGVINPLVLAAAKLVGISEIYRVGGAQAVAALAYGTATMSPVDKVVGPGNTYVAAAKRRVFGDVGIDMIAGPSEILVLADA